jgi:hypothetical protein
MENLELRMYGLVPYNLSPIQQGIQFGHSVVEYSLKSQYKKLYNEWASHWKTFIILNGGTTNTTIQNLGSMNNHLKTLYENNIEFSSFYEPDLGDQLTAITFIVDERVFNYEKYPDYIEWLEKQDRGTQMLWMSDSEEIWVEFIGGKKNVFLREFLKQFKLA